MLHSMIEEMIYSHNIEYYKKFWVGLMDGDGSIQVNHWRKKNLQYRLVIKLKYTQPNHNMLQLISKYIGGYVRIITNKNKSEVLWIENNKKNIIKIIEIFKVYTPLTFRLFHQLKFLNDCLLNNDVHLYLKNRNKKYNQLGYRFLSIEELIKLPHWNEWLSGFIEAEGCFSIRKIGTFSFSIGQKNEQILLQAIKKFFDIKSEVKHRKKTIDFFILETYNKNNIFKICNHLKKYHLLGEKAISLNRICDKFI